MKKTKQNYLSGIVGGSAQSLVLTWLLQGERPRQSSEHRCTASIGSQCPNELVKIQKVCKRKWKQNKRDIPAVYILLFQDVYFYRQPFSLTSKQFIFKYFFRRGATLVVVFSSEHTVFSLCLSVRLHVWFFYISFYAHGDVNVPEPFNGSCVWWPLQNSFGQWQSQIKPTASTRVGTIYQMSLSSQIRTGEKPHWPGDTMRSSSDVCWRAKGWIPSRWHMVLLVSTALFQALWRPTRLAGTLPPGWELPQCWLGEEIQIFALCPSRKQESLSLHLWEDFTFDSSWREIEKKHTLSLAGLEVVCTHRLGL